MPPYHRSPRSKYRFVLASLFAVTIMLANGCGDGRPKRVPVAGQVLIDGKPLTHGQIMFVPASGRPSQGQLDNDGRFVLSCYEQGDGALMGSHKVAVTAGIGINNTQTRWYAPKKYAEYRTSGLTREITGPVNDLVIKISWDGGHEFVETEGAAAADNEGMQGKRGQKKAPEAN